MCCEPMNPRRRHDNGPDRIFMLPTGFQPPSNYPSNHFQPPSNRLLPTPPPPPRRLEAVFRPCAGAAGAKHQPEKEAQPRGRGSAGRLASSHENQHGGKIVDAIAPPPPIPAFFLPTTVRSPALTALSSSATDRGGCCGRDRPRSPGYMHRRPSLPCRCATVRKSMPGMADLGLRLSSNIKDSIAATVQR
jgi:hypothetical protein